MKDFLGEDYPAWQDSFLAFPEHGIRINELKTNLESFRKMWTVNCKNDPGANTLEAIDWIHNGFHIRDTSVFSMHPYYQAGLYYIQEPSAMTPAELMPVEPGDYILDLCAAPGGKSTELLSKLRGTGILYANDISVSRAQALRKNLEMAGASNAYITAEDPGKLAAIFPHFFNKILVDGPCSGEGMFRRKPDMISEWEKRGPDYYAPIQSDILRSAVLMLRPGGMLLYSTCTFSETENEDRILSLLRENEDLEPGVLPDHPGFLKSRVPGLENCCIRIMPHRMRGEGQFVCLLKKRCTSDIQKDRTERTGRKIYPVNNQLYLLPYGHMPVRGIRYLMTGLHVGSFKSGRLNPTQALAQALSADEWPRTLNLSAQDDRLIRYLRGESISIYEGEITSRDLPIRSLFDVSADKYALLPCSGPSEDIRSAKAGKGRKKLYKDNRRKKAGTGKDSELSMLYMEDILILADGFPVGFGSENRGLLKNKRNPGWRML